MKKLLIAILFICLLLTGCKKEATQAPETTAVPDGVYTEYGNGGTLPTAVATYKDGVEVSRDRYRYSIRGDIIQMETVVNGKVTVTIDYNYQDGYLYQQAEQYSDDGVAIKNITTFSGDEKTLPVSLEYYEDGVFKNGEKYTYDEKDNMVKREIVGEDHSVSTHFEYSYDENGKMISSRYYEFGCLAGTTEYTYDENGNPIEKK